MKNIIKQRLLPLLAALITTFFLSISNSSAIDIEDFGWSFDNDFDYVYSMLNHDKPKQCKSENDWFPRAVNQQLDRVWGLTAKRRPDFYSFKLEPYKSNFIDDQLLPKINHFLLDKDCNRERAERFTYCPTNKKIVEYEVELYMTEQELLAAAQLNEGSDKFIGFTKDEILLEADFPRSGVGTTIRVYNNQTKTLRQTRFFTSLDSEKNRYGTVRHLFMKTLDEEYRSNLCPRDVSSKIIKPEGMLTGLRLFIENSTRIIVSYDQKREVFNQCSALFPENKSFYSKNWEKYKKMNQSLYDEILNASTQVMLTVNNEAIKDEYDKWINGYRYIPNDIEGCENWSENVELIKDRYNKSSIDYVLKYLDNHGN